MDELSKVEGEEAHTKKACDRSSYHVAAFRQPRAQPDHYTTGSNLANKSIPPASTARSAYMQDIMQASC